MGRNVVYPSTYRVIPRTEYSDSSAGTPEQARIDATLIPRSDRNGEYPRGAAEADLDRPIHINPGSETEHYVTTLRQLMSATRGPGGDLRPTRPLPPRAKTAAVSEPAAVLDPPPAPVVSTTPNTASAEKLRQFLAPGISVPSVPRGGIVPPQTQVNFSDRMGEMVAHYHAVLCIRGAIILVYDTRYTGGPRWFPATNTEPLLVNVEGKPQVYRCMRTGLQFDFESRTFCILTYDPESVQTMPEEHSYGEAGSR